MKVSELKDAKLDYWVAKAEGKKVRIIPSGSYPYDDKETEIFFRKTSDGYLYTGEIGLTAAYESPPEYSPSTDWAQGGPIIEREGITIEPNPYGLKLWAACSGRNDTEPFWIWKDGEKPLIAAMHCYVASKFGEEVPDE